MLKQLSFLVYISPYAVVSGIVEKRGRRPSYRLVGEGKAEGQTRAVSVRVANVF